MIDKKELISTYLQQFGSHYQISRLLNVNAENDESIDKINLIIITNQDIGYDKRSDNGVTDSGRKIMGRKGIGKLATFSLTNTVRVLSSKDHKKAGCILDFKRITEDDAEPDAINPDVIIFDEKRLSKNGTGTRLELIGVKKKITVSFRFIVSKLMRTFDVNDLNFSIHIRNFSFFLISFLFHIFSTLFDCLIS